MPTGYTHAIADGISFRQYAMSCARAFGALITMRDEPHDAEIPEAFQPDTHYLQWAEEAKARLAALEAMTPEQKAAGAKEAYEKELASREKSISEARELQRKYEDMLFHAENWVSPSPDHDKFKQFMIDQIKSSIEHDCTSTIDYYTRDVVLLQPADQWHAEQVAREQDSIARYERHQQEEVERVAKRNLWISQLRNALK
jgi:hypothetical protein